MPPPSFFGDGSLECKRTAIWSSGAKWTPLSMAFPRSLLPAWRALRDCWLYVAPLCPTFSQAGADSVTSMISAWFERGEFSGPCLSFFLDIVAGADMCDSVFVDFLVRGVTFGIVLQIVVGPPRGLECGPVL